MHCQTSEQDNHNNHIGNYQLQETVGAGAFGVVKKAIHLPTGEQVAVKIILKSKIKEVADVERVSRQMHILKIVRHPSIIQLYEIIETKRYLFLITQYIRQGELFQFVVKQGHLQQPQACLFFRQLISGIKYLRDMKISHRDLKLENLLLDDNNQLKIIDFGLSNTYQEHQELKTACGSPCYAAPEMIIGKSYDGSLVDIWSCGIILFALVCGYLPFQDPDTHQLYKKIRSGLLDFPDNVSHHFKDIISRILSIDPNKRYGIEDIEEHPWFTMTNKPLPTLGIKVGIHVIKADPIVLGEMKKMGFDIFHAKSSIQVNKHGPDLAAYYLQLKKMKRQGYESEYDINSIDFKYSSFQEEERQSFENTRKSYYFGVHPQSSLKKSRGKSAKKVKASPSKTQFQVKRKRKVNFPSSNSEFIPSKIQRTTVKKPEKYKNCVNQMRKKKRDTKSFQLMDSPVRRGQHHSRTKKKQYSSSGNKSSHLWRDKKTKSCSLIERFH